MKRGKVATKGNIKRKNQEEKQSRNYCRKPKKKKTKCTCKALIKLPLREHKNKRI